MTCTCTPMSTCAECAEKMICYDTVDRFLRNNLGDDDYAEYSAALDAAIAAAVAKERERCAKVCDSLEAALWREYKDSTGASSHTEGRSDGAGECAAAIRATQATPLPPAA